MIFFLYKPLKLVTVGPDDITPSPKYANNINDKELLGNMFYASSKKTGLSRDIIIDNKEQYKKNKNCLVLYVVENKKVYPIRIYRKIMSVDEQYVIPDDIFEFIEDYRDLLNKIATKERSVVKLMYELKQKNNPET